MKNFERALRAHIVGASIDPELSEPLRATSAEAAIAALEAELGIHRAEPTAETAPDNTGDEGEGERNADE